MSVGNRFGFSAKLPYLRQGWRSVEGFHERLCAGDNIYKNVYFFILTTTNKPTMTTRHEVSIRLLYSIVTKESLEAAGLHLIEDPHTCQSRKGPEDAEY
eukprot:scaffold2069_cov187-Amphora_coffeaeformis.AAC.4